MKFRQLIPFLVLIFPNTANAQWVSNGAPVSATVGSQAAPIAIPDGSGAFIVYTDSRGGSTDIYAQRVDEHGKAMWALNGVPVCSAGNNQSAPALAPDGTGGAIFVWYDFRNANNDIYAQRINASGAVQWATDGVAVCSFAGEQVYPTIVPDGIGGAVVAWQDSRIGTYDIYAQRINASGVAQWTANGVTVCASGGDQWYPQLTTDGASGAIVAWHDYRSGTADVYSQRMNSAGTPQWTANGIAIANVGGDQLYPTITSDGAGGAIVTWQDSRANPSYSAIYAQRTTGGGSALWGTQGAYVGGPAIGNSFAPVITSDGASGAIIAWYDNRSGTNDIFIQHMSASGAPQWTSQGLAICTAVGGQSGCSITSNGNGGAIVSWTDGRVTLSDIYAQHVSAPGDAQWTADGAPICTAASAQITSSITSNGSGGAIVAWGDARATGNSSDVYAQRIEGTFGYWGHPEPVVTSVADIPNDQGGKVAVNWKASGRDAAVPQTITYYTIWRAVDALPANLAGGSVSLVSHLGDVRQDAMGPVYCAASSGLFGPEPPVPASRTRDKSISPSMSPAPPYYWELVGTQEAHGWGGYTFSASTRADSVAANAGNEAFMVAAHIQTSTFVAFPSNAATGHSVDNLAPPAPLFLTANRAGSNVNLEWNRVPAPDLKSYSVYRATAAGVTPIPMNFLANDDDTLMVDSNAPTSALYYIVTAGDVHANQSAPSNEAQVSAATGVGNLPPITALTVMQNYPNPFTAETALQVGLPSAASIKIEVYDVAGRRVRESSLVGKKGWQAVSLSSLDDRGQPLASGVYFFRVNAGGETATKKFVITR